MYWKHHCQPFTTKRPINIHLQKPRTIDPFKNCCYIYGFNSWHKGSGSIGLEGKGMIFVFHPPFRVPVISFAAICWYCVSIVLLMWCYGILLYTYNNLKHGNWFKNLPAFFLPDKTLIISCKRFMCYMETMFIKKTRLGIFWV